MTRSIDLVEGFYLTTYTIGLIKADVKVKVRIRPLYGTTEKQITIKHKRITESVRLDLDDSINLKYIE
jgi:hypothetical protein